MIINQAHGFAGVDFFGRKVSLGTVFAWHVFVMNYDWSS